MKFTNAGEIGHAWILSSPSREEAMRGAREIAAAAVCERDQNLPCGACRSCRKAFAGTHPDISIIQRQEDKNGKLRREITISQVREMILEAQLKPIEARRRVTIIDEAERMNLNAQNAALKLLEEPPASAVFVLCVQNRDLLLETVRSRCRTETLIDSAEKRTQTAPDAPEGQVSPSEESDASAESSLAAAFLKTVASGKPDLRYRWIASHELSRGDDVSAFLDDCLADTADRLCGRASRGELSPEQWMAVYRRLELCTQYARSNVNAKHIFSLLTAIGEEL